MDKATYDRLSAMGYRDIFRICREDPALDSGSPDVQFLLALCVRDGRGIRKDEKTFRKVLEWCVQKGSLLAIGYQAGYEQGRLEARPGQGMAAPLSDGGNAPAGAEHRASETGTGGGAAPREKEQPVTVLYLTRPTKKKRRAEAGESGRNPADGGAKADGNGRNPADGGAKANENGRNPADGGSKAEGSGRSPSGSEMAGESRGSSAYANRVNPVLGRLYFEGEDGSGKKYSEDFLRIHRVLVSNDEAELRSFWASGEYDGFLARMPEEERGEVLADLLVKINQYQLNEKPEIVNICRQMALRVLEGKVYISDLQLSTKNDAGEKEHLPVLWFAVWLGDPVLAKYLLQSGANPNLVRSCRLAGGVTLSRYALGECILQGNQAMARLLLDYGANVRKMDGRKGADGSESLTSPLAYAVLRNSAESVFLLLEKGINPNEGYHYRDKEGKWHLQTALYLAVQHTKNLDIAKILLEAGASADGAGPLTNVQGDMLKTLLKYTR